MSTRKCYSCTYAYFSKQNHDIAATSLTALRNANPTAPSESLAQNTASSENNTNANKNHIC